LYIAQSAAFQTTAAPALVATGTAIKTLLQVTTPASIEATIVEWGIDLDAPVFASRVICELIDTGAIAGGSPTAQTPGPWSDPNGPASGCTAGFQPTSEGSIVASRVGDVKTLVPPFNYLKQWPLGREWMVGVSRVFRVRVTATVTCNAYAYVIWEE